ncbi:MAG: serine protease [Hyphomonadaceae bacterium]
MRFVMAAAVIAASLAVSHIAGDGALAPVASEARGFGSKQAVSKPARGGGAGADTCRWANDNECDEPDIGTGACPMASDYSDCRALREGENDSCRWARDGECDEAGFGTGACVQGTDRTDCGEIAWMRNQNDSCDTAFNGACEEPGQGNGRCAARTDRADCHGRNRPMTINDHFFGRDDRQRVNTAELPWRLIGRLELDTGESCTATLIGPDAIVTAAHCIHTQGGPNAAGRFVAAHGGAEARVIAYQVDQRFNYQRFVSGDEIDGLDWALLRLDQRLGDRLGFAGVQNLTGQGRERALAADLYQAGFAWDTGSRLTGHLACHMIAFHPDNTFMHECDTTRGDSGSSFMVRSGAGYDVIGVDSSFRSNPGGPFLYVAVSAAGFQQHVADFVGGRSGIPVGGRGAAKPKAD